MKVVLDRKDHCIAAFEMDESTIEIVIFGGYRHSDYPMAKTQLLKIKCGMIEGFVGRKMRVLRVEC